MARPRGHKFDEVDLHIIRELQDNPLLPYEEIGEKVGLAYTPCRNRVTRLINNGYVKPTALIARKYVKWALQSFVLVKLKDQNSTGFTKFIDAAKQIENIVFIGKIMGDYDVILSIYTYDAESFGVIIGRLGDMENVSDTHSYAVLKVLKEEILPPQSLMPQK